MKVSVGNAIQERYYKWTHNWLIRNIWCEHLNQFSVPRQKVVQKSRQKQNKTSGFICTSKLSFNRKCSKSCDYMYFSGGRKYMFNIFSECWQVVSLGQPPVSPAIPWHHYGVWDPSWLSQIIFCNFRSVWLLRDDSHSSLFVPVGLNVSKHSLAVFHLVSEMSTQGPQIIIFSLTVLPTIESSVTALECAHHFV